MVPKLFYLVEIKSEQQKRWVELRLKEIEIDQRPRERLKTKGIDSLNDAELFAIILQNGSFGENVIDLSHRLISTFSLEKLNSRLIPKKLFNI